MTGQRATVDGIHAAEAESALRTYLVEVRDFLTAYIAFPSEHEPVAVALWTAHTHVIERLDVSPILALTSAEMHG